VNDKVVSDDEIGQALREASDGNVDVQVAVVADSRVPYSQLVTAIDKARIAGFHRVALAASPNRDEHSPDSQKP
jgi:biopolymer transport protein ExbD